MTTLPDPDSSSKLATVACTAIKSDSSEQDAGPTTIPVFPRTKAGIVDSLTYFLSTQSSSLNEWSAPKDQSRCAAEKIVDKVGEDHFLPMLATLGATLNAAKEAQAA